MRCPHCQVEDFIEGSALLGTVGISFAHLNCPTEKKVTNLPCDNCGLIQWFGGNFSITPGWSPALRRFSVQNRLKAGLQPRITLSY